MKKKNLSIIIFWGALWGLEEATIGHFLHITSFHLGWFIWFPLAYFFMNMVYKQTGALNSIIYTSFIAAAIKFIDIFVTVNLQIIICPALSIVLEGLSLFAVLKLFNKNRAKLNFIKITSISLLWRTLFAASILAIPSSIMAEYPYYNTLQLFKFILFNGLINSAVIFAVRMFYIKTEGSFNNYLNISSGKLIKWQKISNLSFNPLVSFSLLVLALVAQWAF